MCQLQHVTLDLIRCLAPPGEGAAEVLVSTGGFLGSYAGAFEYRYKAHHVDIESGLPAMLQEDMMEVSPLCSHVLHLNLLVNPYQKKISAQHAIAKSRRCAR